MSDIKVTLARGEVYRKSLKEGANGFLEICMVYPFIKEWLLVYLWSHRKE